MQNVSIKGFIYAALSSATFGLAPFFTISLLLAGFSSFEVLAYRWGIASLTLVVFGIMLGETFRISSLRTNLLFILGNGVHPQPAPGSYLLQSGHRLSEHSQRSGIHHSFHVSAGRGTGHDGLFRRKEVIRHSVCRVGVTKRSWTFVIRQNRL